MPRSTKSRTLKLHKNAKARNERRCSGYSRNATSGACSELKRKKVQRRKGGGCGCASGATKPFFMGGKSRRNKAKGVKGGFTNTLLGLPAQHYYPLNNYNSDPNHQVVDARLVGNYPTGGLGSGTRRRRVKGGSLMGNAISTLQMGASATLVGANDYTPKQNYLQQPSVAYTSVNPPTRMA